MKHVSKYFDREYYLSTYPDVRAAGVDPLKHYYYTGWKEGRNPSATFQTSFYINEHLAGHAEGCPLVHYADVGRIAGLSTQPGLTPDAVAHLKARNPSGIKSYIQKFVDYRRGVRALVPFAKSKKKRGESQSRLTAADFFDAQYYLQTYSDIGAAGVDPKEHYFNTGWREGRNPSAAFQTDFYIKTHLGGKAEICPLFHYAKIGKAKNLATSAAQANDEKLKDSLSSQTEELIAVYRSMDVARTVSEAMILNVVRPMFSASTYREKKSLPKETSDLECLIRYISDDLNKGRRPSLLFDGKHYIEQATKKGLSPPDDAERSYLHWLKLGLKNGICPASWFDEQEYLRLNPDLASYPDNLFLHFVRHGIREGRKFIEGAQISAVHHPLAKTTKLEDFIACISSHPEAWLEIKRNTEFLHSDTMSEIHRRAMVLEPAIDFVPTHVPSYLPHWHDDNYRFYEIIRQSISERYDNAVIVPFCKLGGADFVSAVLANNLASFGKTVILRTDLSDWARPDWFSAEVTSIDLSPHLYPLDHRTRKRVLYELIRQTGAKNVFNVNSRLAFETFEAYGARLRLLTNLFAYYFCADRTLDGREAGYPISFFANIIPHLECALFDTRQLADTLVDRYCLSGAMRKKIVSIYTPSTSAVPAELLARTQLASRRYDRPVLLWAGRFDRQKRFDLLLKIAFAMPGVTFKCWGAAVLDEAPSLKNLPFNLEVYPPFNSYDELPLNSCDGFLYTSEWDGLPTILIEMGRYGMPIVASSVGGVPELIDEETGWPVHKSGSVKAYVKAINALLRDPDERVRRAEALQRRVRNQHSPSVYRMKLSGLLASGGRV